MIHSIIWSPTALVTFGKRIEYLNIHFTEREILNFKNRVTAYLDVLKEEPLIGKRAGERKDIRIGLIIKEVSLIYRIKLKQKEVQLIMFFDNRQNPKKIRKYLS